MPSRQATIVIVCTIFIFVVLHLISVFELNSPYPRSHYKRPTSVVMPIPGKQEAYCTLPADAERELLIPTDTTSWKTWVSIPLRLKFSYPPTWSISETSDGLVVKPQDHDRNLPYRGDGDQVYGINISTSTDINALGLIRPPQSLGDGLLSVRFPLQQRWLQTKNTSALIVYCIFDYSEGITALIPTGNDMIQVSISRFAEGFTPAEDWKAFFGVVNSLQTAPAILR